MKKSMKKTSKKQESTENVKRGRGRPSVPVEWPDGEFTLTQVLKGVKLSRVALQLKANKAVDAGTLKITGQETPTKGRPQRIFSKV